MAKEDDGNIAPQIEKRTRQMNLTAKQITAPWRRDPTATKGRWQWNPPAWQKKGWNSEADAVWTYCSTAFIQPAALKHTVKPYAFVQRGIYDIGHFFWGAFVPAYCIIQGRKQRLVSNYYESHFLPSAVPRKSTQKVFERRQENTSSNIYLLSRSSLRIRSRGGWIPYVWY
jgi:hypothetical protein